jgi:hypothetical protein
MASGYQGARSICWDCERACTGCSWSQEFIPVKGWKAIPTKMKQRDNQYVGTYIVCECPQFKRDAYDYGLKWAYKKVEKIPKQYPNGKKRRKP